MPAAVAVPLALGALSAGTQLYGAKKASDASKNASKAQQQAADKAFQYQREERDRMSGLNAPFMQGMGTRANTLRSLTTPGEQWAPPPMRQPQPQPMQGGPQMPPQGPQGTLRGLRPPQMDPEYQQYLQGRMGGQMTR